MDTICLTPAELHAQGQAVVDLMWWVFGLGVVAGALFWHGLSAVLRELWHRQPVRNWRARFWRKHRHDRPRHKWLLKRGGFQALRAEYQSRRNAATK